MRSLLLLAIYGATFARHRTAPAYWNGLEAERQSRGAPPEGTAVLV